MKLSLTLMTSFSLLATGCSPTSQSPSSTLTLENQKNELQADEPTTNTLKTLTSPHAFEETVARVETAIRKRPLNLFNKIDHAEGAAQVGLALSPSTLFIFGNPKGGTPLMARNPQMGFVLPLKMHVYQDGNTVKISYTDIEAETKVHGLNSAKLPIPNIAKMLNGLAAEVTAPSEG